MVATVSAKSPPPPGTEPAWEIARLFPLQGAWSESEYLALDTNHLVEFTDGYVEVLPMPKPSHQRIVKYLSKALDAFATPKVLGESLFAPLRVKVRDGKFREPDVIFMLNDHAARKKEDYWEGADFVIEVVSDDNESFARDYSQKRADYAEARIGEYWIVDPQEHRITVLKLEGGAYVPHGEFGPGQRAASVMLDGFSVDVNAVFAAAKG